MIRSTGRSGCTGRPSRRVGDGALDRAAALAGESLALFEQESGPFHPDVANVLNCLARVHEQRADYAAAEACGRRSVDVMRRVRGEAVKRGEATTSTGSTCNR